MEQAKIADREAVEIQITDDIYEASLELGKLFAGVTIAHGGVLPNINPMLLLKRNENVAASTPKSPSKAKKSPKKA
ncbi:hypothetical protein KIW84_063514 [Lathyrus oleraceus]|uniref:Histone H2A C-terminal domain-containing protein n=1 Tax=Pisum sativum TaxID=3888 RepID=A0A9D5A6X0_PEA|nr:hypothetical protein KIW84_063514 [Pisum sativum]